VFTLDASVPAELAPLSWLLGVWEGTGVIDYKVGSGDDAEHRSAEFRQRISFSHDGLPYLNYSSATWLLPGSVSEPRSSSLEPRSSPAERAEGESKGRALAHVAESGYWRLHRPLGPADPGPGMLPATGDPVFTTVGEVETLRNEAGGFDIEVAIIHPTGVSEFYLGQVRGPRIDLATDAVVRSSTAKEYAAATRLYGLVQGHLLWAWDIAALGQDLRTHASARLARLE